MVECFSKHFKDMKLTRFFARTEPCDQTKRLGALAAIITSAISFVSAVAAFVNHLTPTFAGILNFKVRLVLLILLFSVLAGMAVAVIFASHECPSPLVKQQQSHYTYRLRERILAICVLPFLLTGLTLSVIDLKYWIPNKGPFQGIVLGTEKSPLAGVTVDALNLDKEPVTSASQITDTTGRFVLDVVAQNGSPAYLTVDQPSGCHTESRIPWNYIDLIGHEKENKHAKKGEFSSVFAVNCHSK